MHPIFELGPNGLWQSQHSKKGRGRQATTTDSGTFFRAEMTYESAFSTLYPFYASSVKPVERGHHHKQTGNGGRSPRTMVKAMESRSCTNRCAQTHQVFSTVTEVMN